MSVEIGNTSGPASALIGGFEAATSARRASTEAKQAETQAAFASLNVLGALQSRSDSIAADMDRVQTQRTNLLLQEQTALAEANNYATSKDIQARDQATARYNAIKSAREQTDARVNELSQSKASIGSMYDSVAQFAAHTSGIADLALTKQHIGQLLAPMEGAAQPAAQQAAPSQGAQFNSGETVAPAAAATQAAQPAGGAAPAAAPVDAAAQQHLGWVQAGIDPSATLGPDGKVVLQASDAKDEVRLTNAMQRLSVTKFGENNPDGIPFTIVNAEEAQRQQDLSQERQARTEAMTTLAEERQQKIETKDVAQAALGVEPMLSQITQPGSNPRSEAEVYRQVANAAAKAPPELAKLVVSKYTGAMVTTMEAMAKDSPNQPTLQAVPTKTGKGQYVRNLFGKDADAAFSMEQATSALATRAGVPDVMPKIVEPDPGTAVRQFWDRLAGADPMRPAGEVVVDPLTGKQTRPLTEDAIPKDAQKLVGYLMAQAGPTGQLSEDDSRRVVAILRGDHLPWYASSRPFFESMNFGVGTSHPIAPILSQIVPLIAPKYRADARHALGTQ